jgi:hypothetical protein
MDLCSEHLLRTLAHLRRQNVQFVFSYLPIARIAATRIFNVQVWLPVDTPVQDI